MDIKTMQRLKEWTSKNNIKEDSVANRFMEGMIKK